MVRPKTDEHKPPQWIRRRHFEFFFGGPADLKRGEGSAWQVQCVEDGSLNRVSTETFRWAVKVAFSGADLDDVMICADFDHVAGRLTVKELVGSSATSGVETWKWWQFAKEKSPGTVVKFVTSSHRLAEECFLFYFINFLMWSIVELCKCQL